jgi:uncharacterized protein YpmB
MKKWLVLGFVLVILIIWLGIDTYQHAFEYRAVQAEKAIQVAQKEEPDLEVLNASYYNGNDSYTILYGVVGNQKEEQIICIPDNSKKDIIKVNPSNGITADEAVNIVKQERNPAVIKSVNFGIEQDVPIWEVVYLDEKGRYSYYYLTFKDGQFIKRYTL